MEVDYLILGKGICGTLLSRHLVKTGANVMVIDDKSPGAASRVAGGIINPVTGKRLVRSWMVEQLLPFAMQTYQELEEELSISLVKECSLLDFYPGRDQQTIFEEKATEGNEYLSIEANEEYWASYFRFNYGIGKIAPCLLVDIAALVNSWEQRLKEMGCLIEGTFSWKDCIVETDGVMYKNIRAKKIICCEGAGGAENPYFDLLPWSKDKGEAIIASIPGLPRTHIFKQEFSIVPWHDDLFWIGAAHDWKYTHLEPTAAFRKKVEEQFDYWLKIPYTITDHIVGLRPANLERKPFVGLHPGYPSVGILNGMGGKGVSMAPYFANELAEHLLHETPIMPDVDVKRFSKVLSRVL